MSKPEETAGIVGGLEAADRILRPSPCNLQQLPKSAAILYQQSEARKSDAMLEAQRKTSLHAVGGPQIDPSRLSGAERG